MGVKPAWATQKDLISKPPRSEQIFIRALFNREFRITQKSDHEPDLTPLVGPSQHMKPVLSVKDVFPRQPKMPQFRVVPPTPIGICLWYMRMDIYGNGVC